MNIAFHPSSSMRSTQISIWVASLFVLGSLTGLPRFAEAQEDPGRAGARIKPDLFVSETKGIALRSTLRGSSERSEPEKQP